MFINIQDPSDTQKSHLRRAIRSQAALSSASCRKSTIAAKAATSTPSCSSGSSPEAVTKPTISKKRRKSKANTVKFEVDINVDAEAGIQEDDLKSVIKAVKAEVEADFVEFSVDPRLLPAQPHGWNTVTDPFQTFSTSGSWHESIPRLVDTFLTYIATDEQDTSYRSDRPELRTQFWPEVMSHSTLFFTGLLIATTHPSFSGESSSGIVAWCRQEAMHSIQDAINTPTSPETRDTTIAAISLLAGWELEYGDDASFYAHMEGLKTMVGMRGGIDEPSFPPVIRKIVLSVTHDLLSYAGITPVFESKQFPCRRQTSPLQSQPLPIGFAKLKQSRLLFPVTADMIGELDVIMGLAGDKSNALSSLQFRLKGYSFTNNLSVNYCPLQSITDDAINVQAENQICLALLCLIFRQQQFDIYDLTMSSALLQPEKLLGTVYAEVCTWALMTIGSTLPYLPASLLQGLKRLIISQHIQEFPQARQLMRRFFYPPDMEPTCKALWDQLAFSANIDAGVVPITRYNSGVFRPKTGTLHEIQWCG